MSRRRLPSIAVGLGVIGGLLLVGATSASWVMAERLREIGGVPLTEPQGLAGVELAPRAVAAGVLAALCSLALTVVRGRGRRLVGAVLVAVGSGALAFVVGGVVRAASEPGQLTPAPWVAVAGALAAVAAGALAWRRPSPPPALGSRYTLEAAEDDGDGEWGAAADEG